MNVMALHAEAASTLGIDVGACARAVLRFRPADRQRGHQRRQRSVSSA
jgi:hypothetical protein